MMKNLNISVLQINYDKNHDVLYLYIGTPKESYGEEDDDGFIIRKSFETDEITGFTLLDFNKNIDKIELFFNSIDYNININEIKNKIIA